jgi:hypothetical protein
MGSLVVAAVSADGTSFYRRDHHLGPGWVRGLPACPISAVEAGTNHHALSLDFASKLATALSADLSDLLNPAVAPTPSTSRQDSPTCPNHRRASRRGRDPHPNRIPGRGLRSHPLRRLRRSHRSRVATNRNRPGPPPSSWPGDAPPDQSHREEGSQGSYPSPPCRPRVEAHRSPPPPRRPRRLCGRKSTLQFRTGCSWSSPARWSGPVRQQTGPIPRGRDLSAASSHQPRGGTHHHMTTPRTVIRPYSNGR